MQFFFKDRKIYIFIPETGELDYLADDMKIWAREVINDYKVLTGYPSIHQRQARIGALPVKTRLIPTVPFVAGGKFALENLYSADAVQRMRFRTEIANQIKNLPDGHQIKFEIVY